MRSAPRGTRLHIGIFGRRNAGKSSVLNALTRQETSIVSPVPGTTADPVEKPMEFLPIGPVLFIDTAGLDDTGELGSERAKRARRVWDRTDLAVVVAAEGEWGGLEEGVAKEFLSRGVPVVAVFNKADLASPDPVVEKSLEMRGIRCVRAVAPVGEGLSDLREALLQAVPESFIDPPTIAGDLVPAGEVAVLVAPIDAEAPRGRLILPQVQVIRDLLDHGALCVVVKEQGLRGAMDALRRPPALVVTDSQAFQSVAGETPVGVPLTSFSILFARYKGDLEEFASGARAIRTLRPGDRVLIAEACSHHPVGEDIGRVKIPRWLSSTVGGPLDVDHVQGHDFPSDLSGYKLVVQCGGCMVNRREVMSRVALCRDARVPITNYGMAIALSLGILDRALAPFHCNKCDR